MSKLAKKSSWRIGGPPDKRADQRDKVKLIDLEITTNNATATKGVQNNEN